MVTFGLIRLKCSFPVLSSLINQENPSLIFLLYNLAHEFDVDYLDKANIAVFSYQFRCIMKPNSTVIVLISVFVAVIVVVALAVSGWWIFACGDGGWGDDW